MSEPITHAVDANEARRRPIRVRPGLLVNLVTHLEGGVEYEREELGAERIGERQEGEAVEWRTEKRVADVEEHAAAVRLRGRVRSLVKGACVWTPFGLICPLDQEALLGERIAEGHRLVQEFNAGAQHTRIRFPEPLRGRITEDSREALSAVREEIHSLVSELQQALAAGSPETIRDVAQKATQMSKLLEDGSEARTALDRAVKESRRVATELVKRLGEGAEAAAEVLASANIRLVASARMAFEEDETGEITDTAPSLPSAAVARFDSLGEDYAEPPSVLPAPPASPGIAVGETLAARLSEALESFDRGPGDVVMEVGACVALVSALPARDIAIAFGVLMKRHPVRGEALIDSIAEDLPEEIMEALDAVAGIGAGEEPPVSYDEDEI